MEPTPFLKVITSSFNRSKEAAEHTQRYIIVIILRAFGRDKHCRKDRKMLQCFYFYFCHLWVQIHLSTTSECKSMAIIINSDKQVLCHEYLLIADYFNLHHCTCMFQVWSSSGCEADVHYAFGFGWVMWGTEMDTGGSENVIHKVYFTEWQKKKTPKVER